MAMTQIALSLLGPVEITWAEGQPPRFRSPTAVALLGYLVAEARPMSRDALTALFWPDQPHSQARGELRRILHNLSAILPDCILAMRQSVRFEATDKCQVDTTVVRESNNRGDLLSLKRVAALYRGEFLEGLYLDNCPEFETWLLAMREYWHQQMVRALHTITIRLADQGEYEQGLDFALQLLILEPWREEAHRQVMWLLAHRGQLSAALQQYEQCKDILAKELSVSPAEATIALYESIKSARGLPAHNIPSQPTPFIGRAEELAALKHRLADPACRLLTITGMGGVGKSRLALEAARLVAVRDLRFFLHGVILVPLAGVDGQDLISAIGVGLGIAFSGQQSAKRQLLTYLRDMELLLVLDNYEHLLPETTLLSSILGEAPAVKLLITSRERLNLKEEWLFEVDGLPYPEQEIIELDELDTHSYAAVDLFVACAQRVRPSFSLEMVGQEVAAICCRVQGLPLALELSAARLASMTAADVLVELEHGTRILATDMRNLSPRHTSLRAAFDASWRGLSAGEQKVLSRLSLFRAGFTGDAASEVAGATVAVLGSLSNKSLIRLMPAGRYKMHELLRQYAAAKLGAEPEAETDARERYAVYYGALLREHERRLLETQQIEALNELTPEQDNVRRAWRWLVQHERVQVLETALWTLFAFYFLRGQLVEGLGLIEETLAGVVQLEGRGTQGKRLRARLSLLKGFFLNWVGQLVEARRLLEDALNRLYQVGSGQDVGFALFILGRTLIDLGESRGISYLEKGVSTVRSTGPLWLEGLLAAWLAECLSLEEDEQTSIRAGQLVLRAVSIGLQLNNPWVLCNAFLSDGRLAIHYGEYQRAERACEKALVAAQSINNCWMIGLALADLGRATYWQGKFARARAYFYDSGLYFRRMGAKRAEAIMINYLGETARVTGEADQALTHYQQSIVLHEEVGNLQGTYWVACNMGHALLRQLHLKSAIGYFRYSLAGLVDTNDEKLAGMILTGLAGILNARGQPEVAAKLGGAAAARFVTVPRALEPADNQDWERILAEIKDGLEEEAFVAAWKAGQALSLGEAFAMVVQGEDA